MSKEEETEQEQQQTYQFTSRLLHYYTLIYTLKIT